MFKKKDLFVEKNWKGSETDLILSPSVWNESGFDPSFINFILDT